MHTRLGFLLAIALLAGCHSRDVSWSYPEPAPLFLSKVGTLAVGPFESDGGLDLGPKIAKSLTQSGFYAVRDGTALEALTNERYLTRRLAQMEVGKSTDDEVGTFLGASDALLTGHVTESKLDDSIRTYTVTEGDQQVVKDFRRANYSLSILVEVRAIPSGEILFERAYDASNYIDGPDYPDGAKIPPFERRPIQNLRANTATALLKQLTDRLEPSLSHVAFTVYSDKRVPGSVAATEAAMAGDWPLALEFYEQGARKADEGGPKKLAKYRARAHYCKGVALIALQRFEAARAAFRRAQEIAEDGMFTAAQRRATSIERSTRAAVKQARAIQAQIDAP